MLDAWTHGSKIIAQDEPSPEERTDWIRGVPTQAGTYMIRISAGVGTETFKSARTYDIPFVVLPRKQTLTELYADIEKTVNSFVWTASTNTQSATDFRLIMTQK